MSNLKHSKSPGTRSLALDRQAPIDWHTMKWNKPDISMPPWLACWRKFWNMSWIWCSFNWVSTGFGISIFWVLWPNTDPNINVTYPCTSDFPITPKVSEWSAGYIILNTIVTLSSQSMRSLNTERNRNWHATMVGMPKKILIFSQKMVLFYSILKWVFQAKYIFMVLPKPCEFSDWSLFLTQIFWFTNCFLRVAIFWSVRTLF